MLDKLNTKNAEVVVLEFQREFESSYDVLKVINARELLEEGYLTEEVLITGKDWTIKISPKGKKILEMCGK